MMAIKKFANGSKIGVRARKELARELGCSDRQLLVYLKRKHLWSHFFSPSRKLIYGISDGIHAENSIKRPQIIRSK